MTNVLPLGSLVSLPEIIREWQVSRQSVREIFTQLDDKVLRLLARGAGKLAAWKLIEGLKPPLNRVRFLSFERLRITQLVDLHNAVVKRIAAENVLVAESPVRPQLRHVMINIPAILSTNPDYFDLSTGDIPEPVNTPLEGA